MKEFKIVFLGTSAGVPVKDRFNSSMALIAGENIYLIECGDGSAQLLVKNNLNINKIKAIFVSHLHVDHFGGMGQLIQTMQIAKRRRPLKLFIPREGKAKFKSYREMLYLMDEVLPFKIDVTGITSKDFLWKQDFKVSAHPNKHLKDLANFLPGYPANKGQSYSFVIKAARKKIVFSGDLKNIEELTPVIDNTDILICELAHFRPMQAVEYLKKIKIPQIIFTHINHKFEKEIMCIKSQASKYIPETKIHWAEDGKVFTGHPLPIPSSTARGLR